MLQAIVFASLPFYLYNWAAAPVPPTLHIAYCRLTGVKVVQGQGPISQFSARAPLRSLSHTRAQLIWPATTERRLTTSMVICGMIAYTIYYITNNNPHFLAWNRLVLYFEWKKSENMRGCVILWTNLLKKPWGIYSSSSHPLNECERDREKEIK